MPELPFVLVGQQDLADPTRSADKPPQLLMRSRVALDSYRTGVPGPFIRSAATPSAAGAHGMCPCRAAGSALRYLRLASRKTS